jgi:chromate reductase
MHWSPKASKPQRVEPGRILAISGSLRRLSVNSAFLRVLAGLSPPGIAVHVSQAIAHLPLFNPDRSDEPPEAVKHFFAEIVEADALVIASPEYAHGVTGTIKNALDWLVGFEPFAGKGVAVINASPRASHADAALCETLRTMAANIVGGSSMCLALLGAGLDEDGMAASPMVQSFCKDVYRAIRAAAKS